MEITSEAHHGRHIVACTVPLWGHTKGLCALLARLVRTRRDRVALFTGTSVIKNVFNELEKHFHPEEKDHLMKLISVTALAESSSFDFRPFIASFIESYRALVEECATASNSRSLGSQEAIRPPQVVILQFFMYEAIQDVRNISGKSVPIYVWQPASAAGIMFRFGPEMYGGNGDLSEKIKTIVATDENARNEEAEKIYNRSKKELISIPGIPPMYDYEFSPQQIKRSVSASFYAQFVFRMFEECDGVILYTNPIFEGPALSLWEQWLGRRPVIAVGPMPPIMGITPSEREGDPSTLHGIQSFLNRILDEIGPYSIVYISFGTVWWPAEPAKIWVFLDVLLEMKIPFLFSHASPSANIPEDVEKRVAASGLGYMAKWFPQPPPSILGHKACGWFMTHCGHNSIMEALLEGVPLICWPFLADQPSNAANIVVTHNAGYELFEVRSGYGLWPIHRLGGWAPSGTLDAFRQEATNVLTAARGSDGEEKRKNAQELRKEFLHYWEEGGTGWDELKKVI